MRARATRHPLPDKIYPLAGSKGPVTGQNLSAGGSGKTRCRTEFIRARVDAARQRIKSMRERIKSVLERIAAMRGGTLRAGASAVIGSPTHTGCHISIRPGAPGSCGALVEPSLLDVALSQLT